MKPIDFAKKNGHDQVVKILKNCPQNNFIVRNQNSLIWIFFSLIVQGYLLYKRTLFDCGLFYRFAWNIIVVKCSLVIKNLVVAAILKNNMKLGKHFKLLIWSLSIYYLSNMRAVQVVFIPTVCRY